MADVVPNVKKIRGLNLPGTPRATSACCGMTFTLIGTYREDRHTDVIEAVGVYVGLFIEKKL